MIPKKITSGLKFILFVSERTWTIKMKKQLEREILSAGHSKVFGIFSSFLGKIVPLSLSKLFVVLVVAAVHIFMH